MPSNADLDYPAKLSLSVTHGGIDAASLAQRALDTDSGAVTPAADGPGGSSSDVYAAWYPPLSRGLALLSKLYQSLDRRVYEAFAQDILMALLEALADAVPRLRARQGEVHAQLFLIKHLLALREQISPFEGDFAMRQVEIDFGTLRAAAQGLLVQGAAFFRLDFGSGSSSQNASAATAVTATEVDARKQVDESLRAVCQAFIQATAKALGQPLASFLVQVDALPAARRAALSREPFAAPGKIAQRLAEQDALLSERLPELRQQLELYLGGSGSDTEGVLFRPIQVRGCMVL